MHWNLNQMVWCWRCFLVQISSTPWKSFKSSFLQGLWKHQQRQQKKRNSNIYSTHPAPHYNIHFMRHAQLDTWRAGERKKGVPRPLFVLHIISKKHFTRATLDPLFDLPHPFCGVLRSLAVLQWLYRCYIISYDFTINQYNHEYRRARACGFGGQCGLCISRCQTRRDKRAHNETKSNYNAARQFTAHGMNRFVPNCVMLSQ